MKKGKQWTFFNEMSTNKVSLFVPIFYHKWWNWTVSIWPCVEVETNPTAIQGYKVCLCWTWYEKFKKILKPLFYVLNLFKKENYFRNTHDIMFTYGTIIMIELMIWLIIRSLGQEGDLNCHQNFWPQKFKQFTTLWFLLKL